MGRVIMSGVVPKLSAPVQGVALADMAEGSIVYLNENGSPVEFYVACHNYESSLNGTGRTLLVRKDCYDTRVFNSSNNVFSSSAINTWLNNTYLGLLDADTQAAVGTTKFYCLAGNGSTTVTTLSRAIFLLSATELGDAYSDGAKLDIAGTLRIAYRSGSACTQWTRTPASAFTTNTVCYLSTTGNYLADYCYNSYGSRPVFTLPSTALFDEGTLLFKEVS